MHTQTQTFTHMLWVSPYATAWHRWSMISLEIMSAPTPSGQLLCVKTEPPSGSRFTSIAEVTESCCSHLIYSTTGCATRATPYTRNTCHRICIVQVDRIPIGSDSGTHTKWWLLEDTSEMRSRFWVWKLEPMLGPHPRVLFTGQSKSACYTNTWSIICFVIGAEFRPRK